MPPKSGRCSTGPTDPTTRIGQAQVEGACIRRGNQ
jgi:hypothetical protein